MKSALLWLLVLGGMVVIIISVISKMNESAAMETNAQANLAYARGQAESMIIRAQAESRLTAATASAITSAAMLPWGVLGILGLLGLAVVALAVVAIVRPPRYVERQIIYLPPPYTTRFQLEQNLSKNDLGITVINPYAAAPRQFRKE